MKTKQGYKYWIEDGKYTIDGYDFFDSLADLEADIEWQILWIDGKAYKDEDGWHLVKDNNYIIAKCNMTGKVEGEFESMDQLRKVWPSAEITCIEHHDGYTVVYC